MDCSQTLTSCGLDTRASASSSWCCALRSLVVSSTRSSTMSCATSYTSSDTCRNPLFTTKFSKCQALPTRLSPKESLLTLRRVTAVISGVPSGWELRSWRPPSCSSSAPTPCTPSFLGLAFALSSSSEPRWESTSLHVNGVTEHGKRLAKLKTPALMKLTKLLRTSRPSNYTPGKLSSLNASRSAAILKKTWSD